MPYLTKYKTFNGIFAVLNALCLAFSNIKRCNCAWSLFSLRHLDGTKRTILNDSYMYGDENYVPGNIILAVPQVMSDVDVPNITITITDKSNTSLTGKVTVNLLGMNIEWRSGFIYCYGYLDELSPGDDKVRGPETITVVFDPEKHTDQW